ncbi:dehydrogenase/reductase SDR family member 7 isoform X1 [Dermacentor silvarum]|uniref:dehydrogenase/reductase SDR family member 7 isoform X1 n=1 Tax=Dermacentor silvarum TaxID=543639 RepID=UPI0018999202|nr:dehydrogenase/reductase SDR family member 7 isoform X1 [Dermacentor silvarum]
MACCLVSWLLYTAVSWLVAFAAWFKLADADLTLLFKSKFGLSIATLRGKVIWITGASSGIGEYLAYELAKVGSRLILSGTNLENLELVKNNCIEFGKDKGTEVLVLPFSICDFSSHSEQLQKVLDHFGKLDVLVNNAGRSQRALFEDISVEVDKEMFDCNVFGAVSLTRCVVKYFKENGVQGHIVVTSSTAGRAGAPFSATYIGCKHALQGYYECLRMEGVILGGLHVTITCPGPVFSRIRERALTATPGKLYNKKDTPNARLMPTERCAQLIAVAIANKMDEVWISQNPILLLVYLAQYMPSIFRNYVVKLLFTEDRVRKMREGQ